MSSQVYMEKVTSVHDFFCTFLHLLPFTSLSLLLAHVTILSVVFVLSCHRLMFSGASASLFLMKIK